MSKLIFLDTEFVENGPAEPIRLISIGLVDLDGQSYYAENSEVDLDSITSQFIKDNVIKHLKGPRRTLAQIKQDIIEFVGKERPEFWGYYSAYDWVMFCQIFGRMIDLPENFPYSCFDLAQLMFHSVIDRNDLPRQTGIKHNALEDARWNREVYEFINKME